MSDRHKEALAHLSYGLGGSGLGENGGFALLTGEVGTGKTTISRCLMEQLPDNTQVAFILNPTLSSQELLATVCDELKIRYRKTGASLKSLTDKIAEKLLKNHKNDINTLLIIDEAQHLQPDVLEQLRLLTNLETNTKKLLQVILIGQPELQQLLQRRDLRQLAQRITARYHLMPLTKQELSHYISHRLLIAGCPRILFNQNAITKIHQLSGGIPRLINLLCHSALMIAYNQNDSLVNKKIVLKAAGQALGEDLSQKKAQGQNRVWIFSTVLSVAALLSLTGFWWLNAKLVSNDLMSRQKQDYVTNPAVAATVETSSGLNNDIGIEGIEGIEGVKSIEAVVGVSPVIGQAMTHNKQKPQQNTLSMTKVVSDSEVNASTGVVFKKPLLDLKKQPSITYQVEKVDAVSDDLLARFKAAIEETERENQPNENNQEKFSSAYKEEVNKGTGNYLFNSTLNNPRKIKPLTQKSAQLQNALPNLNFEQHVYTSDGQSWVTVNGRDRYQGDYISDQLRVDDILPQQVILSFKGEKFSLPALTNWQ